MILTLMVDQVSDGLTLTPPIMFVINVLCSKYARNKEVLFGDSQTINVVRNGSMELQLTCEK